MTKREIYEAWAPPGGVWSPWTKPVLFAHLTSQVPAVETRQAVDAKWAPSPSERVALIVELPGAESVATGLALAGCGYRPVPLFNACPAPWTPEPRPSQLVDVDVIQAALVHFAGTLNDLGLPADAPPAFLLDASRDPLLFVGMTGLFDNRSVHFATDFPSSTFLATHRIVRSILVRKEAGRVAPDLVATLHGWQRGGIALATLDPARSDPPSPLTVRSPGPLAEFFARLRVWLRMRRNPRGGFGGLIPEASDSSVG